MNGSFRRYGLPAALVLFGGGRWHYISLPASLGLGRAGDIVAQRFEGAVPTWSGPWTPIELFYPGQVSWPHLNSTQHAGAEFANGIYRQWLWTLAAGIALIAAFGIALNQLLSRKQGV